MEKSPLEAQPRTIVGGGLNALRQTGYMPGVLYGHDFDPVTVQVADKDFETVFKEAGQSTIVYVSVNGQSYPAIIHDVTIDPVSDKVMHADFYKVSLDEKITTSIQVVVIGESPAVKDLGGILVKNINELEVEALPQDLPHEITIDISTLIKFDDHIMVKDLKLGSKVELKARPEDIIVLIQEPISEEQLKADLEAPSSTTEEVEVIKKEKTEEVAEEDSAE